MANKPEPSEKLANILQGDDSEPTLPCDPRLGNFQPIPQLAFGLYKIPEGKPRYSIPPFGRTAE